MDEEKKKYRFDLSKGEIVLIALCIVSLFVLWEISFNHWEWKQWKKEATMAINNVDARVKALEGRK